MLPTGANVMDELQKRNQIVVKAREKYIPATTMNISEALRLYLKHDAKEDERIPLVVSRENRPKNWVDLLGRPDCPNCKISLLLNQLENKWVCTRCGYEKKIRARICAECKIEMRFYPVNTSPKDQTGDDSKGVWICSKCMETIYTTQSLKEVYSKGGI